jgi:hypothetical protein
MIQVGSLRMCLVPVVVVASGWIRVGYEKENDSVKFPKKVTFTFTEDTWILIRI